MTEKQKENAIQHVMVLQDQLADQGVLTQLHQVTKGNIYLDSLSNIGTQEFNYNGVRCWAYVYCDKEGLWFTPCGRAERVHLFYSFPE